MQLYDVRHAGVVADVGLTAGSFSPPRAVWMDENKLACTHEFSSATVHPHLVIQVWVPVLCAWLGLLASADVIGYPLPLKIFNFLPLGFALTPPPFLFGSPSTTTQVYDVHNQETMRFVSDESTIYPRDRYRRHPDPSVGGGGFPNLPFMMNQGFHGGFGQTNTHVRTDFFFVAELSVLFVCAVACVAYCGISIIGINLPIRILPLPTHLTDGLADVL